MLGTRNNTLDTALGFIKSFYRGILVARSIIATQAGPKLAFIQAKGRGDPDDPDDGELVQEADLDHVQHYGFESSPPVDTELVIAEIDGGEVVIGERDAIAASLDDLVAGESRTYGEDLQSLKHKTGGDIEMVCKAGQRNRLAAGSATGATVRDVAYAHNTEAGASNVASGAVMNTYSHNVFNDIAAIKTDVDNLRAQQASIATALNILIVWSNLAAVWIMPTWAAPGPSLAIAVGAPAAVTLAPNTADGINTDVDHSYVSSGSATSEVEP